MLSSPGLLLDSSPSEHPPYHVLFNTLQPIHIIILTDQVSLPQNIALLTCDMYFYLSYSTKNPLIVWKRTDSMNYFHPLEYCLWYLLSSLFVYIYCYTSRFHPLTPLPEVHFHIFQTIDNLDQIICIQQSHSRLTLKSLQVLWYEKYGTQCGGLWESLQEWLRQFFSKIKWIRVTEQTLEIGPLNNAKKNNVPNTDELKSSCSSMCTPTFTTNSSLSSHLFLH